MKNINIKKISGILSHKNIAIIGHMGSGKSAFSRKVAKYLNIQHVDTDREIVKFENKSINHIFLHKGEEYFRKIERKIVSELLNKINIIISLGGGSILDNKIRELLKKNSFSVYLEVDLNILKERLNKTKARPLLINVDILSKLQQLDLQRNKYYLNADLTINNSQSINKTLSDFIKYFD